jgi:HSP90 family molecular chaperone
MKLVKHTNVEEVIGVQQQHKFKITDGSQAIIMDSLINLYSDPIGSIVREITSNCIDANRERDLKLANKIPMEGTDDVSFWSTKQTVCIEYIEKNTILGIDECIIFHDSGCGLSQDRVANVFTTFGASTKRDNNFEIGGFGLGAKSPLAYTDTFYVSSRHNGTETYYMIYRNNDNVPHMDQVYQCNTDQ